MPKQIKPTLLVAGPGAGKTYGMVHEIVAVAPELEPTRFLAAITFTNTAADSIREGVGEHIHISPNIFIGTIHSFLIRFLIKPYATILGLAGHDKTYFDIELAKLVSREAGAGASGITRGAVRNSMLKSLYGKGLIPRGLIPSLAAKIIEDKSVRAALGNRLQFLFVDELQDVDRSQYKVFDQIRIAQRTSIYAVGDPEQYITSHAYAGSSTSKPDFEKIPFQQLARRAEVSKRKRNRRSCEQIVQFANNFHCELDQVSRRGRTKHGKVVFIDSTDLEGVLSRFREMSSVLQPNGRGFLGFYLGYKNDLYKPYVQQFELRPIGKRSSKTARPLQEVSRLLCSVSGMSQRRIRGYGELDRLEFRGLALKLLRKIIAGEIHTEDEVKEFVLAHLPNIDQEEGAIIERSVTDIADLFAPRVTESVQHRYATIHKAKGLEAPAVLAVAETLNELKQWLITDTSERLKSKSDRCRLGYVAFTRAEDLLCIGCKKPLDLEARAALSHLKVEIVSAKGTQFGLFAS